MAAREDAVELTMDPASLYREEVFTDRKAGVILLTPGGVLPLAFEIAAATLGEAVATFGDQAKAAVQQALDEVQELRRQAPRLSSWQTGCRAPPGYPVAG
jgi:hypothetical protein